jgi:hypothetical protein
MQRFRIGIGGIAVLSGLFFGIGRYIVNAQTADDLDWPWCYGQMWFRGLDPYLCVSTDPRTGHVWPGNPLTTMYAILPFTLLPRGLMAAVVVGSSVALLVYALISSSKPYHLLTLLSVPFWCAFRLAQWSPLMVAVAMLPCLIPLTLAKPQIGFPIFLRHFTWRRAILCTILLALTFVDDPTWPLRWWPQTRTYDGIIPLLTLPGLPLLALLARRRDPDAWFVLLCACMPQRVFYDAFILACALQTRREVFIWTISTWAVAIGFFFPSQWDPIFVAACYWPLVYCILRRAPAQQAEHAEQRISTCT